MKCATKSYIISRTWFDVDEIFPHKEIIFALAVESFSNCEFTPE